MCSVRVTHRLAVVAMEIVIQCIHISEKVRKKTDFLTGQKNLKHVSCNKHLFSLMFGIKFVFHDISLREGFLFIQFPKPTKDEKNMLGF